MTESRAGRRSSWLDEASALLASAGVASPRVDAERLAVDGVGLDRPLDTTHDPGERYWELVARRAAREPLQHLLGRAWFRHIEVAVGPGVFVPRPETEVVTQAAVDEARAVAATGVRPVVVDLGTGTGVIALCLAHEVPASVVHAVEVHDGAWRWARRNTAGTSVTLHKADLRDCLPGMDATVHVVVSNPPYIPPDAVPVDREVREHDPATALYGSDDDGLGHVRAVVETAGRLLVDGGLLVVEHADTQGAAVASMLAERWVDVRSHRDLTQRPRFVTARRSRP